MTFKEWMDEIENCSTRQERMVSELGTRGYQWLRSAWLNGYKQCVDDREKDYEC